VAGAGITGFAGAMEPKKPVETGAAAIVVATGAASMMVGSAAVS